MSDTTANTTKRIVSSKRRQSTECPEICSSRLEDDVRLLMQSARIDGFGRSWSDILNTCARVVLSNKYAGKRIRNLQEKLGIRPDDLKNFCPVMVGETLLSGS